MGFLGLWNDNTGDTQYVEQGQNLAFIHACMYKGNSFSKTYYNVLVDATYNVTMGITSQMNPKNGVIEGYMVEHFENETPSVYIYLDEDWRKKVKFTNIIWGKDLQFIKNYGREMNSPSFKSASMISIFLSFFSLSNNTIISSYFVLNSILSTLPSSSRYSSVMSAL